MTKKEIVRRISERAELTQLKTKEIVQWTFDAIIDTLIQDGRIELRNFGVFEVRRRKARRARNPRTNDRVDVPEKNVVTFQPGKEMEERVRQMQLENQPDLPEVDDETSEEIPADDTAPEDAPRASEGNGVSETPAAAEGGKAGKPRTRPAPQARPE